MNLSRLKNKIKFKKLDLSGSRQKTKGLGKTKIIILAGPPGSGKGTQAELLQERLGLEIIQANQVIREKFRAEPDKPEVIEAKKAYKEGGLIDGKLIAKWIREKIGQSGKKSGSRGLIIDGAARTIEEARATLEFLNKEVGQDKIKLFFIKISPKETIRRNLKRVICETCQKPIPPDLIGKTANKCPYCGGKIGKRAMDSKKIIEKRLSVYRAQTIPAINYLKEKGVVVEINGEQPIEKVYQDIIRNLA